MKAIELGRTGTQIPEIGIGVWRYSGGVEPLRRGVELGAFLIDTAEIYGTEEVVGKVVEKMRGEVFIATKVSGDHLRHDQVLKAAEASLHRLRTDYIDLYQIHWPGNYVSIGETMRAMETLADRGMVKHIGVSNFTLPDLRKAQAAMRNHPIISNQVLYNLNRREIEADLLAYCQNNGLTVIAYTPLDSGRLARHSKYPSNAEGARIVKEIAAQAQKTPAQVALNWCTSHEGVVAIPKSNSAARVAENCAASGWRLSQEHMRMLNDAFAARPDDDWQ
ncbi:MAG: aldo/keto reductase [Candidatus Binataceae bacterium]